MDVAVNTEKWLEKNTGWCERIRARITPGQCDQNKKRARMGYEPLYLPCLRCPGITPGKTMEVNKGGGKMEIYCQACGIKAKNAGRGLCSRCYQAMWLEDKVKQYNLKNAVVVGQEQKQEEQVQPEFEPEPQPDLQPAQEVTQEDDPLADAELLDCRSSRNVELPVAKVSKCGHKMYFNGVAIAEFGLHKFSYVQFFRKDQEILLRFLTQSESNSLRMTHKNNKDNSVKTISISIKIITNHLELKPKKFLQVKGTARPDVVRLVEYGENC